METQPVELPPLEIQPVEIKPDGAADSQGKPDIAAKSEESKEEDKPKRRTFTPQEIARQKELEREAVERLGIEQADFSGFDPAVAEQLIEQVAEYFKEFPEVRTKIKFLGGQDAAKRRYLSSETIKAQIKAMSATYGDTEKEIADKVAAQWEIDNRLVIGAYLSRGVEGIFFKEDYAEDENEIADVMKIGVSSGIYSPGHGSLKGLIDHEMGHALDDLLGVKNEPVVETEYDRFYWLKAEERLKELSYLNKRTNFEEFVAQSWAEYRNAPEPRRLAKLIGELTKSQYNKLFGGKE